jgi:hypothetical protein
VFSATNKRRLLMKVLSLYIVVFSLVTKIVNFPVRDTLADLVQVVYHIGCTGNVGPIRIDREF